MKRILRPMLLAVVLAALLCAGASAADATKGISELSVQSGVTGITLEAQTAAGTAVTTKTAVDATSVYADTERVALTYSKATSGKNYLLIATKRETTAPTADDIVYIDQATADGATVSFNIYPATLSKQTYSVYIASDGSDFPTLTKVAAYSYYQQVPSLELNGSVDGAIAEANSFNWYVFTAPVAGEYVFTTTGALDTIGELYANKDGSIVASDDDSGSGANFELMYAMAKGETLYLKVRAYSDRTGEYRVSVSQLNTGAAALTVGSSVSGMIAAAQGCNWYKFTAQSAGEYVFTTTGTLDTVGYLHADLIGSSVASDDDGGEGRNFRLVYVLPKGGTIYLKVRAYSSETGDYSLTVSQSRTSDTTALTVGSAIRGAIAEAYGYHWYTFTALSTGEYTFTTTGALDTKGELYTSMTGESIASDDDSGSDVNFALTRTLSMGETVYLKVRAYGSRTGSYELMVSR